MTRAYKDIAVELGDANASRAVGTANGRNPLSIVVPCHRVISADGTLGGYAGGLSIKTFLLDMERDSTFNQMRLF
ncbi:Methylated-DNA--protein-cysteine methyltransferase [compost metagenome]